MKAERQLSLENKNKCETGSTPRSFLCGNQMGIIQIVHQRLIGENSWQSFHMRKNKSKLSISRLDYQNIDSS